MSAANYIGVSLMDASEITVGLPIRRKVMTIQEAKTILSGHQSAAEDAGQPTAAADLEDLQLLLTKLEDRSKTVEKKLRRLKGYMEGKDLRMAEQVAESLQSILEEHYNQEEFVIRADA